MATARIFLIVAIYSLAAGAASALAGEPTKIALLVTNQQYDKNPGPLENPHRDGERIAAALRATGFQVVHKRDLTKSAMDDEIVAYAGRLAEAGADAVGFFYYSGHGAAHSVTGENYLIPVGAALRSDLELPIRATKLDLLVETIKGAGAKTNFVVFDACRDTALTFTSKSGTKGLRREERRAGMLIAFATEPRSTATDEGYYAEALADELKKPGNEAGQIFRSVRKKVFDATAKRNPPQFPDFLDKRVDDFYFTAGAQTQTTMIAPPKPIVSDALSARPVITDCDYLAGDFSDTNKVVPGIPLGSIDPRAIPACEAALRDNPENRRFQFQLARGYLKQKLYPQALTLLQSLSRDSYAAADAHLGWMYADGSGVAKNTATAIKLYNRAYQNGNFLGAYSLALIYHLGEGAPINKGKAAELYKFAVKADFAPAMINLASMLLDGEGVPENKPEALRLFQKAADRGEYVAIHNLALIYRKGDGVPKDLTKALALLSQAANMGYRDSIYLLGFVYQVGEGVSRDNAKSPQLVFDSITKGYDFALEQAPFATWSMEFRKEMQRLLKQEAVYQGPINGAANQTLTNAVRALADKYKRKL